MCLCASHAATVTGLFNELHVPCLVAIPDLSQILHSTSLPLGQEVLSTLLPLDPWPGKCLVKLTVPLLGGFEVCLVISQCTVPAHRSPSLNLSSPLDLVTPQSCHSPLQKQPVLRQEDPHSKGAFLPFLPLLFLLYQVLLSPRQRSVTHCQTPLFPVCSVCSAGNPAQAPLIPSDKAK